MQVVNVRQLKSNPSTALRSAKDDLVVVMNRNTPDALLIGFEQLAGVPDFIHVQQAIAVRLFKDRLVSLVVQPKWQGKHGGNVDPAFASGCARGGL